MNILIMGAAGSGKGTMSQLIVDKYGLKHISTGDMFRAAIKNQTELGQQAKVFMDQGKLVPDELTIGIMEERLKEKDTDNGILIDGFPRTLNQAYALDDLMKRVNKPLSAIINLKVGIDTLGPRITGRRVCKDCGAIYHIDNSPSNVEGVCDICGGELVHRVDDTMERLKTRLQEHETLTQPVLDYYHKLGLVLDIDAARSIDEVWHDIDLALEKLK